MRSTRRQRNKRYTRRRHQWGGSQPSIVYYTCFFGPSRKPGDQIPDRPSTTAPCFFFSNNDATLANATQKGWTVVKSHTPIKSTNRDNAVDAKELKTCPHHFKELQGFTYSCYFDTKLNVKSADIDTMLPELQGDVVMMLNKHPTVTNGVWGEYKLAMHQPRYAQNDQKYKNHIAKKVKEGYPVTTETHYETGLILRKSGGIVNQIGEEWFQAIQETGAECQITFHFINQKYKKHIRPLPKYTGRS